MVASSIRETHIIWDAKCSHIEIPHDPEHDFSCHVIWDTCAVKRPMRITYKQHADRLRGCAVNGLRWALADRANANNVDTVCPMFFHCDIAGNRRNRTKKRVLMASLPVLQSTVSP